MSRPRWFACAVLFTGLALAGPTGCGGSGDDVSDLVEVYVRNSFAGQIVTELEMVPAGSSDTSLNLLSSPVVYGDTRFVTLVPEGYYDVSGVIEPEGGGGSYLINRPDEHVPAGQPKIVEITP